ncbi:MAG TPA: zinc-ribbon domain containing protein [Chloroflexaceae bacterium]|nr:zinc-ribbon domain containing protein [Chloroflexaceae bacterium]
MSFADKTITCRDCGMDFVFTAGEQEFYASKGFVNEPTRCPSCRQARKQAMGSGAPREYGDGPRGSSAGPRERVTYKTTCANCGQETTVPFVPRGTKPVYCSNCFDQMRGGSPGRGARY